MMKSHIKLWKCKAPVYTVANLKKKTFFFPNNNIHVLTNKKCQYPEFPKS